MQLRCVELTEFTPPPPKSLVEPHTRVLWVGAIRCLWGVRGRVIAHTEIYILIGGWNFYISDPELSVCLCIRSACDTIRGGGRADLPQTQTESDSARAELMRESRDLHTIASPASYVHIPHTRVL